MQAGTSIVSTEELLRLKEIQGKYSKLIQDSSICLVIQRGNRDNPPQSLTIISINDAIPQIAEARKKVNEQYEKAYDLLMSEFTAFQRKSIWQFIWFKMFGTKW
jgi:hypothetical protein